MNESTVKSDNDPSTLFTTAKGESSNKGPKGFYLKFEIDIVFLLLLGLALWTRTYNLEEPRYIVYVLIFVIDTISNFWWLLCHHLPCLILKMCT